MSSLFSSEDLVAIEATVVRYRDKVLAPRFARPEKALPQSELSAVTAEAREIGLLGGDAEQSFGLWEHSEDPSARAMTLRALSSIGEASPGVAWHLLQLALARRLGSRLGMSAPERTVTCLHGVWGLGRRALPRLLRDGKVPAEESEFLADYFACAAPRELLFQAGDEWTHLLSPSYDASQQRINFVIRDRQKLAVQSFDSSHGLNETFTYSVMCDNAAPPVERATPESARGREIYAAALALCAQSQVAIGLGSIKTALAKARDYAAMRVQGGEVIQRHAAVQELLGRGWSAIAAVEGSLRRLAELEPGLGNLPVVLGARAEAHPQLCAAANDLLQVFGGAGYMRDLGMEKIVRDNNCLRVLGGAPGDLRRFIAAWGIA